ncbi:MAG: hypothetical protein R2712_00055 [Vicinamibacterales bacterium]
MTRTLLKSALAAAAAPLAVFTASHREAPISRARPSRRHHRLGSCSSATTTRRS